MACSAVRSTSAASTLCRVGSMHIACLRSEECSHCVATVELQACAAKQAASWPMRLPQGGMGRHKLYMTIDT